MYAYVSDPPRPADLNMADDARTASSGGRAVSQSDPGEDGEDPLRMPIGRRPGDRSRLARTRRGRSGRGGSSIRPRLYTAYIAYSGGPVMMQAFHASIARHPMEVVQRLRRRFGDEVISVAEIRIGFHRASPLVIALVPKTVADVIRKVERECGSAYFSDFAVDIEQRIEL